MTNITNDDKLLFVESTVKSLAFIEKVRRLLDDVEQDIEAYQKRLNGGVLTTEGMPGVILAKELASALPTILEKAEKQYAFIVKDSMK